MNEYMNLDNQKKVFLGSLISACRGCGLAKKLIYYFLAGIVSVITLSGCDRTDEVYEERLDVLGTFADISIYGAKENGAVSAAQLVEKELRTLEHVGYTFVQEGELHELNEALEQGRVFTVSPVLEDLILTAKEMYKVTGGLINPAAGELTALWEFHCKSAECTDSPYPEEVQKLVEGKESEVIAKHPSMDDIVLQGDSVRSQNSSVRLEFGDLIRGYALERSVEHLARLGIKNALLDIGGSVSAVGSRGGRPWWFHVMDSSGKRSIGYVELGPNESAVSVRAFDLSVGKEDYIYRHVVDPRDGYPVRDVKVVTVIHDNAVLAHATAAALLMAGVGEWASVAEKTGITSVAMITEDDVLYTSPAMEKRIQWNKVWAHRSLAP